MARILKLISNGISVITRKIHPYLLVCILSLIFLTGCTDNSVSEKNSASQKNSVTKYNSDLSHPEFISKSDFLLNTEITIILYDKQEEAILDECLNIIRKYEAIFSRTSESSELYSLNHNTAPKEGNAYRISDELSDIITDGLYYSELSGGAFDISIAPLTTLWNFTSQDPKTPSETDIRDALPKVNYKYIHLKGNTVRFDKDGMGIELGGIAKGYIADRLKEYLLSMGVKSAIINLGGNILCVGVKPDGTPFNVGIQKPFAGRNEVAAVMKINDLSVVSSGVYERYFYQDGILYHHILNPRTGYPFDTNLVSVTIISKKSTDGDGLSTTCFALGLEKGLSLIESLKDTYAVFIDKDYHIYYSKGFEDAISITQK